MVSLANKTGSEKYNYYVEETLKNPEEIVERKERYMTLLSAVAVFLHDLCNKLENSAFKPSIIIYYGFIIKLPLISSLVN